MGARLTLLATIPLLVLAGCQPPKPLRQFGDGQQYGQASAFSLDGRLLATGLADGTVRVWDVSTGAERLNEADFDSTPMVGMRRIAFDNRGARLAFAGTNGSVQICDLSGAAPPRTLSGHTSQVRHLQFSSDGTRLVTVSGGLQYGPDRKIATIAPPQIIAFDSRTCEQIWRLNDDHRSALAMSLSPDGALCAAVCVSAEGQPVGFPMPKRPLELRLVIYRIGEPTPLRIIDANDASLIDFSTDGRLICCGSSVWDVQSGVRVRRLEQPGWFFVGPRRMMRIQGGGGGTGLLGVTADRTIQPIYLDLDTGRSRAAQTVRQAFPIEGGSSAFSHDFKSYVDSSLNLWRLPQ